MTEGNRHLQKTYPLCLLPFSYHQPRCIPGEKKYPRNCFPSMKAGRLYKKSPVLRKTVAKTD